MPLAKVYFIVLPASLLWSLAVGVALLGAALFSWWIAQPG